MKFQLKTHFWTHFDQDKALHLLWMFMLLLTLTTGLFLFHLRTAGTVLYVFSLLLFFLINRSHTKWKHQIRP